jgi:hypothetical protein
MSGRKATFELLVSDPVVLSAAERVAESDTS